MIYYYGMVKMWILAFLVFLVLVFSCAHKPTEPSIPQGVVKERLSEIKADMWRVGK